MECQKGRGTRPVYVGRDYWRLVQQEALDRGLGPRSARKLVEEALREMYGDPAVVNGRGNIHGERA